jgi:hypothetical protein
LCKAALRYDGGPWFRAGHYQAEIDHLGIARSPAYHDEPATNGCVAKFIQTRDVNERCLLGRPAYRTPDQRARKLAPLSRSSAWECA